MKISKTFLRAVVAAAQKLDKDTKKVSLEQPFNGWHVAHVASENPPIEEKKIILMNFKEHGIDREGDFFLIAENIMG